MTRSIDQQSISSNSTSTDADEAAVRAALDDHYAAWAAGDADAFVANYAENATVCLPGVFSVGKAAIRDFMAAGFAGPLRGSTGVDNPISIRLFGDTAIVVSRGGVLMPGEAAVPAAREVLATWVLVRSDEEWLVASYHNCPAETANER